MVYVQSYGVYRLRTKSSGRCSPRVAGASWAGVDNHLLGQIRGRLARTPSITAFNGTGRSSAGQEGHVETAPQDPNGAAKGSLQANARVGEPDFATGCSVTIDIARHIPLDRVMAIRYNWKDLSRLVRIDTRQIGVESRQSQVNAATSLVI